MKAKEDAKLPKVITGKFSFSRNSIHALIDPGSTHSYICTKVFESKSLKNFPSETNMLVTNPLVKVR